MPGDESYERVQPKTRAEWRRWLAKHHDSAPGVWFVARKKASGSASPSYDEQVEEAPRKPRSVWAATNSRASSG